MPKCTDHMPLEPTTQTASIAQGISLSPLRVCLAVFLFVMVVFSPTSGETLELVKTFNNGKGQVKALAFTSDHRYLIWNTGAALHRHRLSSDGDAAHECQALIDRLDAESFKERQQAHIELQQYGHEIATQLTATIRDASYSREARQRARVLLASITAPFGGGHQGEIRAIDPGIGNPPFVASAGRGGNVFLWQPNLGSPIRKIKAHEDGAWAVAFAPTENPNDGKGEIATGGGDNQIRIWNLANGNNRITLSGHENSIHDLDFSPNGRLLASAGSFDKTVRIWNPGDGKSVKVLHRELEPMCVTFHPTDQQLAAAGYGSKISIWNTQTWSASETTVPINGVRCLEYSPDGRWLAAGGDGEELYLLPADSTATQLIAQGHRRGVLAVAFLGDGKTFATGDAGGVVRIWQIKN